MTDILILTFGLVCGFISCTPPGTINLWLINQCLNNRKESQWFILGIVIADCIYAAIAVWGYHTLIKGTAIETGMLALGAIGIIGMGAVTLLSEPKKNDVAFNMAENQLRQFAMGLLMCGGNPTFLVFWIFAVGVLEERFKVKIEGVSLLYFTFGIIAGDYLWFSTLISIVKKFRQKITAKYLLLFNRFVGMTFMVIGTIALIELL